MNRLWSVSEIACFVFLLAHWVAVSDSCVSSDRTQTNHIYFSTAREKANSDKLKHHRVTAPLAMFCRSNTSALHVTSS
jgi:hypothetical protein